MPPLEDVLLSVHCHKYCTVGSKIWWRWQDSLIYDLKSFSLTHLLIRLPNGTKCDITMQPASAASGQHAPAAGETIALYGAVFLYEPPQQGSVDLWVGGCLEQCAPVMSLPSLHLLPAAAMQAVLGCHARPCSCAAMKDHEAL